MAGALKARNHRMNIFVAAVLAFATAYGGGARRDFLISFHRVGWMNDDLPLIQEMTEWAVGSSKKAEMPHEFLLKKLE